MVAAKIDGTALAKKIRESLRADIAEQQKTNPRFQPCLKIIQGMCTSMTHKMSTFTTACALRDSY